MEQEVAHCVGNCIEEVRNLLFALAFHTTQHLLKQLDIIAAACFEDLLFRRRALRQALEKEVLRQRRRCTLYLFVGHVGRMGPPVRRVCLMA